MNIPSPASRKKARIEIIPLIDIVFFLLATFVMVSLSMVKNQGVNVRLPQASASSALERNPALTLTITKDAQIYMDKQKMSLTQVIEDLRGRFRQNKDLKVIINADTDVPFGQAVELLDQVKKMGISKVGIQTRSTGS